MQGFLDPRISNFTSARPDFFKDFPETYEIQPTTPNFKTFFAIFFIVWARLFCTCQEKCVVVEHHGKVSVAQKHRCCVSPRHKLCVPRADSSCVRRAQVLCWGHRGVLCWDHRDLCWDHKEVLPGDHRETLRCVWHEIWSVRAENWRKSAATAGRRNLSVVRVGLQIRQPDKIDVTIYMTL